MVEGTPFGVAELIQVSTVLRQLGRGASSVEEVADRVVVLLRDRLVDKARDAPALPLVRFYVTRRYDDLEPDLRDVARAAGPDGFAERNAVCLVLLATAGEEPAWNDRRLSVNHRAIPLPSVAALDRLPMVAALVRQLGLDPRQLVDPAPAAAGDLERSTGIFFVEDALESPTIPDQQQFVLPYGIRSAAGFGGVLPDGLVYAVVFFSSVPIPRNAAELFPVFALSLEVALLFLAGRPVFEGGPARTGVGPAELEHRHAVVLQELLDARAAVIEAEGSRLEQVANDADRRAAELASSRAALEQNRAHLQAIIEGALDAIVTMNAEGRITDFNRAAEELFGYRREEVVGELLGELLVPYRMRARHYEGLRRYLASGEGPVLGRRIEVPALRRDGTEVPVELAITQVEGVDPAIFNGYIRDLSAVRQAAAERAAGRERLAHLARTLQSSLLPPGLPDIAGFELGALYRPFGDGYDVGGDFYDVFEIGDGRWALALGDVCGKGPEAAAVTAIARYTIRAAAMRQPDPTSVLEVVNDALHRQSPERFCTAALATVEVGGAVSVALGGHPKPAVVSATGELRQVGQLGTLLGPFPSWHNETAEVRLEEGSTLVLFSDGVLEARRGKEQFGFERLANALGRASPGATGVVRSIEEALERFADAINDDVAVLAIHRL